MPRKSCLQDKKADPDYAGTLTLDFLLSQLEKKNSAFV
jgi:hypothetical protein